MKCVQYWPDLEADNDYDVFTISTSSERQYAFYIIRKMKISHKMVNVLQKIIDIRIMIDALIGNVKKEINLIKDM